MFLDNFLHGVGSLGMGRKGPKGSDGGGGGIVDKLYDQLSALLLQGISGVLHIVDPDILADTDLSLQITNDLALFAGRDIEIESTRWFDIICGSDMTWDINNISGSITEYWSISCGEDIFFGSDMDISVDAGVYLHLNSISGVYMTGLKSGATQVAAGADYAEIWKTLGHASLPDNVLMIGV